MNNKKQTKNEDRTSNLENSLDEHLFSKIKQTESFNAPKLSKEEFRKLWSKEKGYKNTEIKEELELKQIDEGISENLQATASPLRHPTENTYEQNNTQDTSSSSDNQLGLIIDLLTRKQKPIMDNSSDPQRAFAEPRSSVRVVRVPLSLEMEDKLIRIRRKLNELRAHQIEADQDIIEDYQVLQALLEMTDL